MGITVLEFCHNCASLHMYLNLVNAYTKEEKLLQVSDILEHESDWLGMQIEGSFETYYTYFIDNETPLQTPVSVLQFKYS